MPWKLPLVSVLFLSQFFKCGIKNKTSCFFTSETSECIGLCVPCNSVVEILNRLKFIHFVNIMIAQPSRLYQNYSRSLVNDDLIELVSGNFFLITTSISNFLQNGTSLYTSKAEQKDHAQNGNSLSKLCFVVFCYSLILLYPNIDSFMLTC